MNSQSNRQTLFRVPAGAMPNDRRIEFFGDRELEKVFFITNGITDEFSLLPTEFKNFIFLQFAKDDVAFESLSHLPYEQALERYVYCVYGSMDHAPDISEEGTMGRSDNFQCGISGCNCNTWKSKIWKVNGHEIKGRILDVLMAYKKGSDDKNVAAQLGISMPTLNIHKKRLFKIFDVGNKTELVLAAIKAKLYN